MIGAASAPKNYDKSIGSDAIFNLCNSFLKLPCKHGWVYMDLDGWIDLLFKVNRCLNLLLKANHFLFP